MHQYKYLIVGGGMSADAAAHGIREVDPEGTIGVLCAETHPPYNRPPLSKALWKNSPVDSIWTKIEEAHVELHLGSRVTHIAPAQKEVYDASGNAFSYDKLLLATGGTPKRFAHIEDHILYYRGLDDYIALRRLASLGGHIAVIGGSFIGSEIAAALTMNGVKVSMVFPGKGIGANVFPRQLSLFLNKYFAHKGIELFAEDSLRSVRQEEGKYLMTLASGKEVLVDGVVAGIGIRPNDQLAKECGISTGNGILVNEFLQTNLPDIYAAGDVANFYNTALDLRMRMEHEDNARTMGNCAGKNMAGLAIPYNHLPYFYSDLFDLGYEAVGELNPNFKIIEDWKEPFKQGVIYYLKDDLVRGVLLWNVWEQVDKARQLIASKTHVEAKNLIGHI